MLTGSVSCPGSGMLDLKLAGTEHGGAATYTNACSKPHPCQAMHQTMYRCAASLAGQQWGRVRRAWTGPVKTGVLSKTCAYKER
jgi:hypothetical protein